MKTHEQFDKLAEQCYVKTGSVQTDYFDYVKFAELIVRECADTAKHHVMNISTYADAEFVEQQIKQQFGVEQ